MTVTDIYRAQETFYVPVFEVKIRDRQLPDDVVHDVMQVTYKDNVKEIDSFEMTIANWDAKSSKPKYEPYVDEKYNGLFDPGQKLELRMGYLHNVRLMMTGEITTLEPNFPASGGLSLSVRGLNLLHRFRTEQHTFGWFDKRDSEIAEDLGQRPLRQGKPGLGIRVVAPQKNNETPVPFVFMDNQYDIVFLMERARHHGYEVVLVEEQQDGHTDQYLRFGPSDERGEVPTYRLEWGKSLASFRPMLSTAKQISEVDVRSWDRTGNRLIEGKATWDKCLPPGSPEHLRVQAFAQAFGNRKEIITNRPVRTQADADRMAKDILCRQLGQMVTASGSTVGLPDLRAGRKLQIAGLGQRFNGDYNVTQTTHTIGDSGYTVEFEAERSIEQSQ
jgi:phage protein D